jgi:hypothetical protein
MSGQLHTRATLQPEKVSHVYCIGGWVVPRASVDVMEKGKFLPTLMNQTPTIQPVAHRYTN